MATAPDAAAAEEFGQNLAALLNTQKVDEVIGLLDKALLAGRATAGLGFTSAENREFVRSLPTTLGPVLTQQFSDYRSAQFLRIQTVGAERRVLIRVRSARGGNVNYLAFVCVRRGTEAPVWIDAFSYASGESISEQLRRNLLPAVAESKKNGLARLSGPEAAYASHHAAIKQVNALFERDQNSEAWEASEKLPAEARKIRFVLLLRVMIAESLDEAKYHQAVDEWLAALPDDPTRDFILIEGALMRKDYPAALRHIDAFARQIGGDAHLDLLAANALIESGRYDDARARARAALTVEPRSLPAFVALSTISLRTKNFADTISVLESLRTQFPQINLDVLLADPDYEEFRGSALYRDWSAKAK